MLRLKLNKDSATPMYLQIKEQLKTMILSGDLKKGYVLMPERKFAELLGVNRTTVLSAYRELKNEGLIIAKAGSGTVVSGIIAQHTADEAGGSIVWRSLYNRNYSGEDSTHINAILKVIHRQDTISFAAGIPAPETYPKTFFKENIASLIDTHRLAFYYSPSEGVESFKEAIAEYQSARGIVTSPENILPVSGAQQGLDLLARLLVEPGDIVVMEDPAYMGATEVFRGCGARVFGIPFAGESLDCRVLENILQTCRPKFIYVNPSFQNPTGTAMPLAKRQQLLALSYAYQVPIIEDDPYSELYFDAQHPVSIKSLDEHDHVIYVGTFSKSVFPGLRLGWINAPEYLIRKLSILKQNNDLGSLTIAQLVYEQFIRSGEYETHLEKVRGYYKQKLEVMENSLRKHLGSSVQWNTPSGGFYLWCNFPEYIDTQNMLVNAADAGVAYVPGEIFSSSRSFRHCLRLNFSYPACDQIETGIKRISSVVQEKINNNKKSDKKMQAAMQPLV